MSDQFLSEADNLLAQLTGATSQVPEVPIEQITAKILVLKDQVGASFLEIGRCLIQAKKQLSHGQWGEWLKNGVDISQRHAERLMQVAEEVPNSTSMSNLPITKIIALLSLPAEERETFAQDKHQVSGEVKTVDEMTVRELNQAIKARQEAEDALKKSEAERRLAEQSKEEAYQLSREQSDTIQRLQGKLADRPVKEIVKTPDDYESTKRQATTLAKANTELQQRSSEYQSQLRLTEAELQAYKTSRVDEKMSIQVRTGVFSAKVKDFINEVAPMAFLSKDYLHFSPDCQRQYDNCLAMLEKFCSDMRDNMVRPAEDQIHDIEVIER